MERIRTTFGGTILPFIVAHVIKVGVITFGSFLWIHSRIPSISTTKEPLQKTPDGIETARVQPVTG